MSSSNSPTIKVINSLNKDEVFYISITENDRMIDLRKEIQKHSVYFSEMSYNRIGIFILIPRELLPKPKEVKKKKVSRIGYNIYDIKEKYPVRMKLSVKNDYKIFENYPYIKNNYNNLTLYTYDIGYQINTPLANFIEYSGPIFILFFYIIKYKFFYSNSYTFTNVQKWTIIMIIFHYIKRVYESLFIHIQINTMEFKMFLVECLYYIVYFGIFAQKQIFKITKEINSNTLYMLVFAFLISEINNFHCHVILRKIRLENSNKREIPKGNLFNYVYCANYFWEICSWSFISFVSGCKSIYCFTFMGGAIMTLWALEKKELYNKMLIKKNIKINNDKKAIIPFVI